MVCEKCGTLLTESNMNVWLTEGMALCIKCEHELKALQQIIGNLKYCFNIIGRSYRKRLGEAFDAVYNHFENKRFGGYNEA